MALSAFSIASRIKGEKTHFPKACARVLPEMVELLKMTCSGDSAETGLSRSFRGNSCWKYCNLINCLPESWN